MSRLPRPTRGGRAAAVVGATLLAAALSTVPAVQPAHASIPRGDSVISTPDPSWGWEPLFADHFDGPAGAWPDQWHYMPGWNAAAQNGLGQLDVGHLAQIRSTPGWLLPVGTQVRVSASLLMPNTGSNYAAMWVQHPDAADPRELDVIESYGPLKRAGAQLGSHICYDETFGDDINDCDVAGRSAELWPVGHAFAGGAKPWESSWQYEAEFTVGGDQVQFSAQDGSGNESYTVVTAPDPRRVPGNVVPFHLRLSNKDVEPEHALPGGDRQSMLVDWVIVEVRYPPTVS